MKIMSHNRAISLAVVFLALVLNACPAQQTAEQGNGQQTNSSAPAVEQEAAGADGKGIGPVKTVELSATIDTALAEAGKKTFESKCSSCHKFETKYVGPALKEITERRKPEWIMNMILNPAEMIQKDPEAKKLFATFMVAMPNQNMDEKSAREILEYFRSMDQKND